MRLRGHDGRALKEIQPLETIVALVGSSESLPGVPERRLSVAGHIQGCRFSPKYKTSARGMREQSGRADGSPAETPTAFGARAGGGGGPARDSAWAAWVSATRKVAVLPRPAVQQDRQRPRGARRWGERREQTGLLSYPKVGNRAVKQKEITHGIKN